MAEFCDIGAARFDSETNTLLVQCQSSKMEDGTAPDLGELPVFGALGHVHVPYGADDRGAVQGIVEEIDGEVGAATSLRDARAASIYGDLAPGEGAMFSTGPEFGSQVRCQDKSLSLMVRDKNGEDCGIVIDGNELKIQIFGFGHMLEISAEQGISIAEDGGGAMLLSGGIATFKGTGVHVGENASSPVAHGGLGTSSLLSPTILVPK